MAEVLLGTTTEELARIAEWQPEALINGAPQEQDAADQPLALAAKGISSRGIRVDVEPSPDGITNIATTLGNKIHAVAAHAADDEIGGKVWWEKKNAKVPFKVQYWSLLALEAIQKYNDSRRAARGQTVTKLYETSLLLPEEEGKVAAYLENELIREQTLIGEVGPLAVALSISPTPLDPGQHDGQFAGFIAAHEEDLPNDLTGQLEKISTHRFGHNGNLIYCPTGRSDEISLTHSEKDATAAHYTDAFAALLKSGKALDPNELAVRQFKDITGQEIDGFTVIHEIASLIKSGHLRFRVVDHKTLSHIGFSAELEDFWSEHEGVLASIFSNSNLRKRGKAHDELRRHWISYEQNVAVKALAYLNLFALGLKGHYAQQETSDEEIITLDDIAPRIQTSIRLIDAPIVGENSRPFDIPGQPEELPYNTNILLSVAGVPKQITIFEKRVSNLRVRRFWPKWEAKQYADQLRKQFVGRIILRQAMQEQSAN